MSRVPGLGRLDEAITRADGGPDPCAKGAVATSAPAGGTGSD